MKSSSGWGRLLACALLLAVVAIVALGAIAWATLPLDHAMITLDGETVALSGLDGWRAALVVAAVVLAVLVAVVVAAVAAVLAILAAALALMVALACVLATLAVVASPVLIVVWLLWLALRRPAALHPVTA